MFLLDRPLRAGWAVVALSPRPAARVLGLFGEEGICQIALFPEDKEVKAKLRPLFPEVTFYDDWIREHTSSNESEDSPATQADRP